MERYIRAESSKRGITGISVSIARSSGTLMSDGFGFADKAGKKPFTNETISNVGSISKLFTGTAVMKLAQAGKIDIDAPVSRYIPEFSPHADGFDPDAITVRMLLTHESGLDSDALSGFILGTERPADYPLTYRRTVKAANDLWITRSPMETFSYCNVGYSLLGNIIERVSGMSFNDYVEKELLAPSGMADSSFVLDDAKKDRYSKGYAAGKVSTFPYIRDMPAGSLASTSDDMGRFIASILRTYKGSDGLVSKATLDEMFRKQNEASKYDSDFAIGLSWWIIENSLLPGEKIVCHGGDLSPYSAMLLILPERDMGVFAMVNSIDGLGSFSLADIATEALRTFLASEEGIELAPAKPRAAAAVDPGKTIAGLSGYYATPMGLIGIKPAGKKLTLSGFGAPLEGTVREDGSITLEARILGLIKLDIPVLDEIYLSQETIEGNLAIRLRARGVSIGPGVKVQAVPVSDEWKARAREWKPVTADPDLMFSRYKLGTDPESGIFCLSLFAGGKWSAYPLRILSPTEAVLEGIGRSLGGRVTVRVENGKEILTFTNLDLQ